SRNSATALEEPRTFSSPSICEPLPYEGTGIYEAEAQPTDRRTLCRVVPCARCCRADAAADRRGTAEGHGPGAAIRGRPVLAEAIAESLADRFNDRRIG